MKITILGNQYDIDLEELDLGDDDLQNLPVKLQICVI